MHQPQADAGFCGARLVPELLLVGQSGRPPALRQRGTGWAVPQSIAGSLESLQASSACTEPRVKVHGGALAVLDQQVSR